MKLKLLAILLCFSIKVFYGQETLYKESFESEPSESTYTVQPDFLTDGLNDYFLRSLPNSYYFQNSYTNLDGNYLIVAEDIDADPCYNGSCNISSTIPNPPLAINEIVQITTTSIDISQAVLDKVKLRVGVGNVEPNFANYNNSSADFVQVTYSVDGGDYQQLALFSGSTTASYGYLALDTDGDNIGDANFLSYVLQDFSFDISSVSGNSLVIRINISSTFSGEEIGIDDLRVEGFPIINPDVPYVFSSSYNPCEGESTDIYFSGDLNSATAWHIYTGACGGTEIGSTASNSFSVFPSYPGTTYYVRGEGGGISPGSCGTITVYVTANDDDATINYSSSTYCSSDSDPSPTITGATGGAFSSTAGLSLDSDTGAIDLSASTPGTYTVTYTTAGACPTSSGVSVTINATDDATFSYGSSTYCSSDSDPSPTITGTTGGTFSSTAGLSLDVNTGAIDVSASTPGTYTVTYTTAGTCPASSGVSVTINTSDDATFSYSSSAYCPSDSDPSPTITGATGGTFSSTAGLSLDSNTGTVALSASTPGTYTVTYTTAGTCPTSSSVNLTINTTDSAAFSYNSSAYWSTDSDPSPTITGATGGTFSSTSGLSLDSDTGAIDISSSTSGSYTISYSTAGTCPTRSSVSLTIYKLESKWSYNSNGTGLQTNSNEASGGYSTAMGVETTASDYGSLVVGQYNSAGSTVTNDASQFNIDNTAFVIGNGTVSEKSDAFKVLFNGDATVSNNLTVRGDVVVSSDIRLKSNITSLGATLSKLLLIDGKIYTKKESGEAAIGVLAQDIQKVFPELVKESKDGMLSVNYQGLIPILINALKEQEEKNTTLLNKVKQQEAENKKIKQRLARLEALLLK